MWRRDLAASLDPRSYFAALAAIKIFASLALISIASPSPKAIEYVTRCRPFTSIGTVAFNFATDPCDAVHSTICQVLLLMRPILRPPAASVQAAQLS